MKNQGDIINIFCDEISLFYLFYIKLAIIQYFLFNSVNFISLILALILASLLNFFIYKNIVLEKNENFKILFGILFFYFVIIGFYIYAFPYFPIFWSNDFFVHISNALNLLNGNISKEKLFSSNPAITFLLASWLSFDFGNILFFSRIFIAFVLWSSLPLVYFLGKQISVEKGGIISSITYICLNPFLIYTLVFTGLYSNALGLTLTLCTIYWFIQATKRDNKIRNLLIPFYGFSLIFTHSSNSLIYLVLIISTIYLLFFEQHEIPLNPLLYILLGTILILLISPSIIFRLPSTLTSPFVLIEGSSNEFILYILRNIPFLKYFYLYGGENIFVLLLLFVSILFGLIYFFKKKLGLAIIPFSWLILIGIVSLFSTNVWRFTLLAYTPLSLFTPLVYEKILLPLGRRVINEMPSDKFKVIYKYTIIILIFLLLYLPSSSNIIIPIYASSWSRPQQEGFYECLIWFKYNSEVDAVAISMGGGSALRFLPFVSNRIILDVIPGELPEHVYDALKNYSNGYVVVWNRLHPYNGSFYYVDLYKNSSLFREVWANDEVTVFKLVKKE
ncbi:MAG: hypothetical protein N2448_08195 [Caloramator sp.]|nr:hypothetical protein [Caloramator sp.]